MTRDRFLQPDERRNAAKAFYSRIATEIGMFEAQCSRRQCRRARRCSFCTGDTNEPACMRGLDTSELAYVREIARLVMRLCFLGGTGGSSFASSYVGSRIVQDEALRIAYTFLPQTNRRAFRHYRKRRAAAAGPVRDGFMPGQDFEAWLETDFNHLVESVLRIGRKTVPRTLVVRE